ncbi:MarR family transcriptional regulator [Streptomyces syringium]|uniref:MarR family transcriptional regulator n=1 Tax=Streptomyces syringium TaxID=76729 RepID=UPI003F56B08B
MEEQGQYELGADQSAEGQGDAAQSDGEGRLAQQARGHQRFTARGGRSALLEIAAAEERGTPLSPARLSERNSLSTGATTALLNRLETAGHITRAREHSDRRIVTLRSGGHIQERADEFFGPLAHRLDATMSHYPPQLLEQFEAFMAGLNTTMDTHLTEQGPAAPRSPRSPGGRTP